MGIIQRRVGRVSVILATRWPRPPDKCGKEGAIADVWYGKGNVTQASPSQAWHEVVKMNHVIERDRT